MNEYSCTHDSRADWNYRNKSINEYSGADGNSMNEYSYTLDSKADWNYWNKSINEYSAADDNYGK
jgi:hypothetical protein